MMARMILNLVTVCVLCVASQALAADKGDRDTAMALLSTVDASITKGETVSAAEICKRAIAADAACPTAYFKLAQCQEQQNKPREAFKNYKSAADLARKENDANLARKANSAAEKLGGGLIQISEADQKLVVKLLPLAEEAFADEQLETARSSFQAILALQPTHEKAKEGLDKTEKALAARGDPVKSKISGAMLAEIFYLSGSGKKDDAKKMAEDLTGRYADTASGREAKELLDNNFGPPKNLEVQIAEAKKVMKEQAKKAAAIAAAAPKRPPVAPPASGTGAVIPKYTVGAPAVDVDDLEKKALDEAKKTPKDKLVAAYKETYTKGTECFSKAKPGTDGNQQNLHAALEQFIRCEALYLRIDEEKLTSSEIEAMQKQAGTSRYSCMKMTILSH